MQQGDAIGPLRRQWTQRFLAVALVLSASSLHAQPTAGSIDLNDPALIEKANREGDKVFKWILLHAGKRRSGESQGSAAATPKRPAAARPKAEPPAPRERREAAQAAVPAAQVAAPPPAAAASTPVPGEPPAAMAALPAPVASAPTGTLALAAPPAVAASAAPADEAQADEDEVLVPVHQVDPNFPAGVMRRLQKGSVHVRFEVQPDGSVTNPEVLKSSNRLLNDAAQLAVSQWRFKPLKQAQVAEVELAFNLQ